MACRCSPSLLVLTKEIDARFPGRDKASDGCCGDAAHAARQSDHNADASGYAHAKDFDEDLSSTTHSLEQFVQYIYAHPERYPQVKYLIYERRIIYPHDGARPRGIYPYTGANAHEHHLHISINANAHLDTRSWFFAEAFGASAPTPQEDFMAGLNDDEQHEILAAVRQINTRVGQLEAVANRDIDTLRPLIKEVLDAVKADPNTGSGAGDVTADEFVDALAKRLKG